MRHPRPTISLPCKIFSKAEKDLNGYHLNFRLPATYRISLSTSQSWMTRNGLKWTGKSGVGRRTGPTTRTLNSYLSRGSLALLI